MAKRYRLHYRNKRFNETLSVKCEISPVSDLFEPRFANLELHRFDIDGNVFHWDGMAWHRDHVNLLHHVQNSLVFIQPHVVVGNSHGLKCDSLGILEKGIWTPHVLQPIYF